MTFRSKLITGAALLVAIVVFGWCERRSGVAAGAVKHELKANAVNVAELKAEAVVVRAKSELKRKEYRVARAKVQVKGDTIVADGKTVELPSVATLIKVADSRGAQDSASLAKQDLLLAATRKRVDLLEHEKSPRCGKKCGIAIGVGATIGVVWLGVKIIRAVAHK